MKFKGFIETSFVDWDGKISSVLFTGGCNFRCPFCYNSSLVLTPGEVDDYPNEEILKFLGEHSDFIDGVAITGGEPTMHGEELIEFCRDMKKRGFLVKMDTNGTNPDVVQQMLDEKLLDFVAMDFKGPWEKYKEYAGVDADIEKIQKTFDIIKHSGIDYEFRTTLVPTLHSKGDIVGMAQYVRDANWVLQKFQPMGECINPEFSKIKKLFDEDMDEFTKAAKKHAKNVKWRGK